MVTELDRISEALRNMGTDSGVLTDISIAHVVASGHELVSQREAPGIELRSERSADGLSTQITVKRGARIENPVHLCMGVLRDAGTQNIRLGVRLEEESAARLVAHCFFPRAQNVEHRMDASIQIGRGAQLHYSEGHYHGPFGGVTVLPTAQVRIQPHGRYTSDFSLTFGRVGRLGIDYTVDAKAYAIADLTVKIFGRGEDDIKIREEVVLSGEKARSLIRTRVALEGHAKAEVTGSNRRKGGRRSGPRRLHGNCHATGACPGNPDRQGHASFGQGHT